MTRRNHGEQILAGTLTGPAIERARACANVVDWDKAPEWMQRRWIADCWHAIWRELAAAYHEQRRTASPINYRMTEDDVAYAEKCAMWARYYVDVSSWRRVPENRVALEDWERESALAAEQHREPNPKNLDEGVRKRLESRPRRPDKLPLPITEPDPSDAPHDWPHGDLVLRWTSWIEALIETRHTGAQQELLH